MADRKAQSTNRPKLNPPYDKLPQKIQQTRLWATAQPSYDAARSSETFEFLADELALMYSKKSGRDYPLGDTPLIVLTRGVLGEDEQANKQLKQDHDRLQSDLLSLSRNSRQIIAQKSGHHIHLDEPAVVIEAIKQIMTAFRSKKKLN